MLFSPHDFRTTGATGQGPGGGSAKRRSGSPRRISFADSTFPRRKSERRPVVATAAQVRRIRFRRMRLRTTFGRTLDLPPASARIEVEKSSRWFGDRLKSIRESLRPVVGHERRIVAKKLSFHESRHARGLYRTRCVTTFKCTR